jgi:undecaprenyl-diphosphatase
MSIEERLFRFINDLSGRVKVLDSFMIAVSEPYTWVIAGMVIFILALRMRRVAILTAFFGALVSLAVSDLISFEIVKPLVARERPCWLLDHVNMVLGRCGGSYGFTSNHAANAFAVWFIVGTGFGFRSAISVVVLTISTVIAISRVYLGLHFVGDVFGGALLGVATAYALVSLHMMYWSERLAMKISRS